MNIPIASFKDYLKLHFLVVIWGFTAVVGVLIHIPALQLVFYRTLIAVLGMGLYFYNRKTIALISNRHKGFLLLAGLFISVHWLLFFAAARVSNVSACLAGISTAAFWTSILEPIFTKRKFHFSQTLLAGLVVAGLSLIFASEISQSEDKLLATGFEILPYIPTKTLGILMGMASAVFSTLFTLVNARLTHQYDALSITFWEMVGALVVTGLAWLVGSWFFEGLPEFVAVWPTVSDWVWIAFLGLVCTVYAYTEAVTLMKKFTAFAMNLTINLEPLYGIGLAFLFFGEKEKMTDGFYMGGLVILLSVFSYPLLQKRRKG